MNVRFVMKNLNHYTRHQNFAATNVAKKQSAEETKSTKWIENRLLEINRYEDEFLYDMVEKKSTTLLSDYMAKMGIKPVKPV